jgi:molybdopterin-biosynthesis enzyme MoeA-like protein
MNFGAIIIGDEILSGKRQDKHMPKVIETLGARGLQLAWCHYLGDDTELITSTLKRTFAGGDVVFSFGGIGATPDDHTRQCAAQAAGVELKLHPDAETEIRARFGDEITPRRLQMGEFPVGSEIIPNPHNRIPGFSLRDHYFVPGFPQMAWPMIAWVLDTHYAHLFDPGRIAERSIIVRGCGESQLIDLMNQCLARYPQLKVFSLPRMAPERHVELGVRGEASQIPDAIVVLQDGVSTLGFAWADAPAAAAAPK